MPRLHEDWLRDSVELLGSACRELSDLGDGPTLRLNLQRLAVCSSAWHKWSLAATSEEKLRIEEQYELLRTSLL